MTSVPQSDVLIIGAGLCGIACAKLLESQGLSVRLLEKSRGLGGRMSTRRIGLDGQLTTEEQPPLVFDHGAQFLTAKTHSFKGVLHQWFGMELVQPWFDHMGYLQKPKPTAKGPHAASLDPIFEEKLLPRYAGSRGMNSMIKHLGRGLTVEVHQKAVRLTRLAAASAWRGRH
jgi:renalase